MTTHRTKFHFLPNPYSYKLLSEQKWQDYIAAVVTVKAANKTL